VHAARSAGTGRTTAQPAHRRSWQGLHQTPPRRIAHQWEPTQVPRPSRFPFAGRQGRGSAAGTEQAAALPFVIKSPDAARLAPKGSLSGGGSMFKLKKPTKTKSY